MGAALTKYFLDAQVKVSLLEEFTTRRQELMADKTFQEVHLKLLSVPIYIVENLVNLHQLPLNEHFTFMALPLNLKNATASPVRVVALIK
ncbi:hypothetical protein [Peribacillus sp. Hz7]|uniref:hypothetical protein n=1 Tax=Peribacillus sp. Hz7 TaxID=3344873 RepID=UPI0035CACACC